MKDGGPAFPRSYSQHDDSGTMLKSYDEQDGMSLRDWFAGMALSGLMSDPGLRPTDVSEYTHMAMRLYQVADAMLAERNK